MIRKMCQTSLIATLSCLVFANPGKSDPLPLSPPQKRTDPAKMSETRIVSKWCTEYWHAISNVMEQWKESRLSCRFTLERDGRVSHLRIYRSSGSKEVDKTVINSLRKAPLVKPLRKLQAPVDLVVQFYEGSGIRMKLIDGAILTPIGPFASVEYDEVLKRRRKCQ